MYSTLYLSNIYITVMLYWTSLFSKCNILNLYIQHWPLAIFTSLLCYTVKKILLFLLEKTGSCGCQNKPVKNTSRTSKFNIGFMLILRDHYAIKTIISVKYTSSCCLLYIKFHSISLRNTKQTTLFNCLSLIITLLFNWFFM